MAFMRPPTKTEAMKTSARRLHRLERMAATVAKAPSIAEAISERRRRRLEASGQAVESSPPIDYTGCHTTADHTLTHPRGVHETPATQNGRPKMGNDFPDRSLLCSRCFNGAPLLARERRTK